MSAKSIVVNEPNTPAPMSPSRRVPNRISPASETKSIPSAKSASTGKGNQNQNKSGLGGKKIATSRPPESESLASWLRPKAKPQSLVIEKRVEATVMKKPASVASISPALPRRQPSIKHQSQVKSATLAPKEPSITVVDSHPPMQAIDATCKQASGGKRRLGMSRAVVGYPNKKFKSPAA